MGKLTLFHGTPDKIVVLSASQRNLCEIILIWIYWKNCCL